MLAALTTMSHVFFVSRIISITWKARFCRLSSRPRGAVNGSGFGRGVLQRTGAVFDRPHFAFADAGCRQYDIKVLATDIDTNMLAAGLKGIYTEDDIASVPAKLRSRWFIPVPGGQPDRTTPIVEVAAGLRAIVTFRELNFFGPWPMKGCFQVIFCRNAVIYFDEDAREKLWNRFAPKLSPDGVFYVGHSERITGAAAKLFEADGATIYRLRQRRCA